MPETPGIVQFPLALDTPVSLIEASNNASSTLTSGISPTDLLIPVSEPSEYPNTGILTLIDSIAPWTVLPTKMELVIYTSKSGSDLVVPSLAERGAFGTTAQSWNPGDFAEIRPLAQHHLTNANAIIAIENYLLNLPTAKYRFDETPSGAINGSNATFQSLSDFVPESVIVLVNGVAQRRIADFNTSGVRTVTLTESPTVGESVRLNYIIP